MKVLVACEESQEICMAFRAKGHEAYSCDVQTPSGGHPEWHVLGDALTVIQGGQVTTMDGQTHEVGRWDMMIAHPPCTYLTSAGSMRLIRVDQAGKKWIDMERYLLMREAVKFFWLLIRADIPKICVENPAPMHICELPKYSQIIQPYMFGHPYTKRTCLWLKNLPTLTPTQVVTPTACWVDTGHGRTTRTKLNGIKRSAKDRSKTFCGIAQAMAEQWSGETQEKEINNE